MPEAVRFLGNRRRANRDWASLATRIRRCATDTQRMKVKRKKDRRSAAMLGSLLTRPSRLPVRVFLVAALATGRASRLSPVPSSRGLHVGHDDARLHGPRLCGLSQGKERRGPPDLTFLCHHGSIVRLNWWGQDRRRRNWTPSIRGQSGLAASATHLRGHMHGRPNFVVFGRLSASTDRSKSGGRHLRPALSGRSARAHMVSDYKLPVPLGRVAAAVVGVRRNADCCVAWRAPRDQQGGPFR